MRTPARSRFPSARTLLIRSWLPESPAGPQVPHVLQLAAPFLVLELPPFGNTGPCPGRSSRHAVDVLHAAEGNSSGAGRCVSTPGPNWAFVFAGFPDCGFLVFPGQASEVPDFCGFPEARVQFPDCASPFARQVATAPSRDGTRWHVRAGQSTARGMVARAVPPSRLNLFTGLRACRAQPARGAWSSQARGGTQRGLPSEASVRPAALS